MRIIYPEHPVHPVWNIELNLIAFRISIRPNLKAKREMSHAQAHISFDKLYKTWHFNVKFVHIKEIL